MFAAPLHTHFKPSYPKLYLALLEIKHFYQKTTIFSLSSSKEEKKKKIPAYLPTQNIQGRSTGNKQFFKDGRKYFLMTSLIKDLYEPRHEKNVSLDVCDHIKLNQPAQFQSWQRCTHESKLFLCCYDSKFSDSFRANTVDPDETAVWSGRCTVCHSICISWTHYSVIEPHCSECRVTTAIFQVSEYLSPVKRICVFEHSVMTNFNCTCPAIQRGQGSGFLSEGSSWLTACMSEQRRFWRDCADAQARLNLR